MATPACLVRLMQYASLSRSVRLGEEDAMAVQFANDLRKATLEYRLKAVWTHPANEIAGMVTMVRGKPRVPVQIAIAKALGLITGSSDYLFLWNHGSCALEAKSARGSLTQGQRDFRDWCNFAGVPFHVFRTVDDGLAILQQHGILEPE
jgi:hypothetical protein